MMMPTANDPFDGLTLDDAFVNNAKVREAAASDRVAQMQRIDEEHRRIVEQARAHVREQSSCCRRSPRRPPPVNVGHGRCSW